jgi:hypothetical protein
MVALHHLLQAIQSRLDALEADNEAAEDALAAGSDDEEFVIAGQDDEEEEEGEPSDQAKLQGACWMSDSGLNPVGH